MDPSTLKRPHSPDKGDGSGQQSIDNNQPVRKKSRFDQPSTSPMSNQPMTQPQTTATTAAVGPSSSNKQSHLPPPTASSSSFTSMPPPPMRPPPPRPTPPTLTPASTAGPTASLTGAIKKPIIISKPTNMAFNIFAQKKNTTTMNGFARPPTHPQSTQTTTQPPKPFAPLPSLTSTPSTPAVPAPSSTATPMEIDPLEAFMSGLTSSMTVEERKAVNGEAEAEERKKLAEEKAQAREERKETEIEKMEDVTTTPAANGKTVPPATPAATETTSSSPAPRIERYYGDEDQVDESVIEQHNTTAESGLTWLEKQSKIKKKEIKAVDHSTMNYAPFRKDFYIESKEITAMSEEEVRAYRENVMEGVKIRGKNCPKPIRSWLHCGLPDRVYNIIQKEGYKAPFPIQQQAIPVIMSGRDIIACAKTGSGKTLAFVLPMLRHVLDQPLVSTGEGPIAIILAPTRELATQIYNECKKFCKPLNLRVVCVYGGASVSDQITQLKRGAEIIVATPGRMIDMLVCNKGNLTNLHRTTYVVLDEADRMFDMGFEPQVCLAAGSQVTLTHLLSRPIESLQHLYKSTTEQVYGYNGEGVELSQPIAWNNSGEQSCLCITLSDGRSITCTPTHRLLTSHGWIEAQHLHVNESRVLCSLDAIPDIMEVDEFDWSETVGDRVLRLHIPGERDTALAFMRTLGTFTTLHTIQPFSSNDITSILADLQTIDSTFTPIISSNEITLPLALSSTFKSLTRIDISTSPVPSLPSLLFSLSTPRAIIREYLRSFFGQHASAPSVDTDGAFTNVMLTFETLPHQHSLVLNQIQQLLSQWFKIESTITATDSTATLPSSTTLTILDTIQFASSIGFVHSSEKSFRLAVAAAYLRLQRTKSHLCTPRAFLEESGCLEHFQRSQSSKSSSHIPVYHLPVTSITPAGVHATYDIQVSKTHSFLVNNLLVHNCKIIENVRPDRQTVLFSATFPRSVETLAKKALKNPIEIIIGGRSVASSTITQFVEVRESSTKFPRLLEILGKWYKLDQCILIFVDKQEAVDHLFRALNDAGYPCAALHGGMDQADREFTIADFKSKIRTIMVATSIVARGLDVKDLTLVVNYEVPNHYEDYVHRVGRTGRAGKAGTAITFIEPDQQKYAPDLVKGLVAAKQVVPKDLQKMADEWEQLRKEGKVQWASNDGYKTHGFKFDEAEAAENQNQRRLLKMAENPDADLEELAAVSEDAKALEEAKRAKQSAREEKKTSEGGANGTATTATTGGGGGSKSSKAAAAALDPIARQLEIAKKAAAAAAKAMAEQGKLLLAGDNESALAADAKVAAAVAEAKLREEKRQQAMAAEQAQAKARAIAAQLLSNRPGTAATPTTATTAVAVGGTGAAGGDDGRRVYMAEIEINDYPQTARWKVTHKGALDHIIEVTDCAITAKGDYFAPGRNPPPGIRKLHLLIEGNSEMDVTRCKTDILRILEETSADIRPEQAKYGKYSVV